MKFVCFALNFTANAIVVFIQNFTDKIVNFPRAMYFTKEIVNYIKY